MNKSWKDLLEFSWTEDPAVIRKGDQLSLYLALSQNLQDIDHVFNPVLTEHDAAGLHALAAVAKGILDQRLDIGTLSAQIGAGEWDLGMASLTAVADAIGIPSQRAFGALIGLLYVPTCYVDVFSVAVTRELGLSDVRFEQDTRPRMASYAGGRGLRAFQATSQFVSQKQNHSRNALIRYAVVGSILWSAGQRRAFEFDLKNEAEEARFRRYSQFLSYIADNHAAYAEVMTPVMAEKWLDANAIASKVHQRIGIAFGDNIYNPPALADFLNLALVPAGDSEVATHLAQHSRRH